MRKNILKQKLKEGKTVFGTWSMLPSAAVTNVIGEAGLDFVIIDMEHGAMSFETMEDMVRAAELTDCQPIIRVCDKKEAVLLRALEIGSQAIMVPHVSTVAEAKAIVKASRYTPLGERGLSPYTRVHRYSHENLQGSLAWANEHTLVGVLVEGEEGLKNLGKIAGTEGIDLIYLGIYDISQSVGLPGQLNHPKVIDELKKSVRIITEKGIAAGSFARDHDYVRLLHENGFQFIAYLVDCAVLKLSYQASLNFFKKLSK